MGALADLKPGCVPLDIIDTDVDADKVRHYTLAPQDGYRHEPGRKYDRCWIATHFVDVPVD